MTNISRTPTPIPTVNKIIRINPYKSPSGIFPNTITKNPEKKVYNPRKKA